MEPVYYESGGVNVVLGRPPTFVSTQPQAPRSPSGKTSSARNPTELFGQNLLRDITPTALGSGRNRKISWQMRDSSYGGEDFTYEAIGSPQQVLQTSSSKKGVWWGRELDSDQSAGSPLGAKPDGDLSSHECDTEEEVYRHIQNLPYRMKTGLDNSLLALLATANIRNRDGSSTTATGISDSIDGNEDSADVYPLDASCKAKESAATTKDNCTAEASKDTEVRDMHFFPPHRDTDQAEFGARSRRQPAQRLPPRAGPSRSEAPSAWAGSPDHRGALSRRNAGD